RAPAHRGRHLRVLRGNRRADLDPPARSPPDRNIVDRGTGTSRTPRARLSRRLTGSGRPAHHQSPPRRRGRQVLRVAVKRCSTTRDRAKLPAPASVSPRKSASGATHPPVTGGRRVSSAVVRNNARGHMELQQIRYFLAVAKELSFRRAARSCNVAQPSVTNAIKALERDLGGTLFCRRRPVRLSELGEAVLPHFARIAHEVERSREAAKAFATPLAASSAIPALDPTSAAASG